ncbi:MAG: hypothetical protein ACFB21_10185 [Opitutales bacterium]
MAENPAAREAPQTPPSGADRILDAFWEYRLEHGCPPASAYVLCKQLGLSEREFYQHFASLDAIESVTWERLITATEATLRADADYAGYPARQKLLAFFYTYFEHALGQRSRLLAAFPRFKPGPVPCPLDRARKAFVAWAETVVDEAIASQEFADRKQLSERYPDLLFGLFWYVADFNLRDRSDGFQDSDAMVEKSVNTFCDGAGNQFLDSAFDLAKFVLGRR